jgi:sugar O-acyltransferase (sialic acid O-acetyltransferase NeuD family)
MSKPRLILIGAGGHAHACIDVLEEQGRFQIAGLVGISDEIGTYRLGYPVIGSDDNLPHLAEKYHYALITIGQIRSPETRVHLYNLVSSLGFELPVVVSPYAHVSRHATIGAGTIVMHGAIVNAGAKVGVNCIINTRALLEHDTLVQDHCHISTGAIINGSVQVGTGSLIGSCSVAKEGISLGKRCVVGMGLTVRGNLTDDAKFVGGFNI